MDMHTLELLNPEKQVQAQTSKGCKGSPCKPAEQIESEKDHGAHAEGNVQSLESVLD